MSENRLITRLGASPPEAMFAIERILRYLLTLDQPTRGADGGDV